MQSFDITVTYNSGAYVTRMVAGQRARLATAQDLGCVYVGSAS